MSSHFIVIPGGGNKKKKSTPNSPRAWQLVPDSHQENPGDKNEALNLPVFWHNQKACCKWISILTSNGGDFTACWLLDRWMDPLRRFFCIWGAQNGVRDHTLLTRALEQQSPFNKHRVLSQGQHLTWVWNPCCTHSELCTHTEWSTSNECNKHNELDLWGWTCSSN